MFEALAFIIGSIIAVGVIEDVAIPAGKAATEYTVEAVDWTKEKITEVTE